MKIDLNQINFFIYDNYEYLLISLGGLLLLLILLYLFSRKSKEEPVEKPSEESKITQPKKTEETGKQEPEIEKPIELKEGLSKTRKNFLSKINDLFKGTKTESEIFDEMEAILIGADFGVKTTQSLLEKVKSVMKQKKSTDKNNIKNILKDEILLLLKNLKTDNNESSKPRVILITGVNGTGKTTSIGKLANYYKKQGKSVMLAAADTFRAAAIEQLEIWADRNKIPIIKQQPESDPASVVFDAIQSAISKKIDILLVDTAGRLHTKHNLMEELQKIKRVAGKAMESAPHDIWLVIDAITGQNGMKQALEFNKTMKLNGIIVTKLDGTAKGGIVISIVNELKIPVKFIGIGEQLDDLRPFIAEDFVEAIFN